MFEGEDVLGHMRSQQMAAETKRREGLIRRLGEFLEQESASDESHPAALAKKALEVGDDSEVTAYLSAEIDKAEAAQDESRRGELMRWKHSFTFKK